MRQWLRKMKQSYYKQMGGQSVLWSFIDWCENWHLSACPYFHSRLEHFSRNPPATWIFLKFTIYFVAKIPVYYWIRWPNLGEDLLVLTSIFAEFSFCTQHCDSKFLVFIFKKKCQKMAGIRLLISQLFIPAAEYLLWFSFCIQYKSLTPQEENFLLVSSTIKFPRPFILQSTDRILYYTYM